jgi:sugar phosphate isomerase/epimerase
LADPGKYSDIQNDQALESFGEELSESPVLPQFSINQMTTLRASFEDDFSIRQDAGIAAIGLWRQKVDEFGEIEAVETVKKSGLKVTTLSYAGGFTGRTGLQFREALDDGYEAVFTAAAVGARTLIVSPGGRGRYTARHEQRLVTQAIRELSFVAEDLNVQLAVMPRNSQLAGKWTSLNSLEDAVALCDATGQSNVGIVYDSFYLAGVKDGLQTAEEFAERIFTLQLRDTLTPGGAEYDQCFPGAGILPLEETIQCLFENGFAGNIDVQIFSERLWKQDPSEVLSSCQQSVTNLLKSSLIGLASTFGV